MFRSRADAELTAKIYSRVPVLVEESKEDMGNPWGVRFLAMFHMSNDSGLFRTAKDLAEAAFERDGLDWVRGVGQAPDLRSVEVADPIKGPESALRSSDELLEVADSRATYSETGTRLERYVPLYEAKMIHQFDHRWAGYNEDGRTTVDLPLAEKQQPNCEPAPRYWVPENHVDDRLSSKGWDKGWLIGWRDVTRATDERTLISCLVPRVAFGDKFLLVMPDRDIEEIVSIYANLCSLVADFVARQKVGGTSLKYFTMRQIALLSPEFYTAERFAFLGPKVVELTYTSHVLAQFAQDLNYRGPPFGWDEDRRARVRADLDAFYARAYGLTRDELRYILDPADVKGPAYPSETFRVLRNREIRQYGEYRTRRLVLAAWDRMEARGEFRELGL